MAYTYLDILTTPGVVEAQKDNGARDQWEDFKGNREFTQFDENARAFIAARDSFYMASISDSGWPYVQHRGGPPGFLKVLGPTRLGFADYRGNRQYISLGNFKTDDRVALFLMNYPRRKRMKLLAHIKVHPNDDPEIARSLTDRDYPGEIERFFTLDLVAYDWNCPQHITQRFTKPMVAEAMEEMERELTALREENAQLKSNGPNRKS